MKGGGRNGQTVVALRTTHGVHTGGEQRSYYATPGLRGIMTCSDWLTAKAMLGAVTLSSAGIFPFQEN